MGSTRHQSWLLCMLNTISNLSINNKIQFLNEVCRINQTKIKLWSVIIKYIK